MPGTVVFNLGLAIGMAQISKPEDLLSGRNSHPRADVAETTASKRDAAKDAFKSSEGAENKVAPNTGLEGKEGRKEVD